MVDTIEKENEEVLISEQEVWDVVEFGRALTTGFFGQSYLTADLVNARLKDLNLNPLQATADDLETAMKNPKESELQLRAFSQDFEIQSMVYKRLITYLSNILAFDITYTSNAKSEDYSKPRYNRDLEKLDDFLDDFSYKKEFRVALREMLRNDAYFGVIREVDGKYLLQELPPDYCQIVGRWSHGFLFKFNMSWFSQTGVDIDMYPDFFKKKYTELNLGVNKPKQSRLFPETDKLMSNYYSEWVEVPANISACFKLSPELITRLPYFVPLFNDLILQGLMRNLQKNLNMAAASRLLVGEVPMLNKEIKATVKDSIAVGPELLGKFMALLKSAIGDSIRVASAPLQNMRGVEFESDNDMYDSYLRTALASSGINTNLIFTSSVKPNALETQLSLNVDEQMMKALYEQFEDFMNYHIGKLSNYFKFCIEFEGTDFFPDRETRFQNAMTLFDKGIVLPQKIAAAIGMKPSKFRKHMEEAAGTDFMSKLTPPALEQQKRMMEMMPPNTGVPAPPGSSKENKPGESKTGKPGRPQSNPKDLGEEGMKSRETGTNIARGGRV